jgi:hypothetical protein
MNNKFNWRVFISFGLTYAIVIILVSGIMLYMSPPGRYAHWVNWEIWGLTKEGWQAIHTVFSFAFIILSIFHLFSINWKVFVSYLKSKKGAGFNKKREFIISTVLIIVFFFGVIFSIPPFKSVMDFGEHLTNSWEKTEERAPVPHAELLTLAELTEQLNFNSVDEITRKLDNHKIKFENIQKQTLQEIAETNSKTPIEIYEIISKKTGNQRQGSGIGRKTIDDFAGELDKSIDEVLNLLKNNDIEAEKGQTLRTIGENNNLPPRDIYELISK